MDEFIFYQQVQEIRRLAVEGNPFLNKLLALKGLILQNVDMKQDITPKVYAKLVQDIACLKSRHRHLLKEATKNALTRAAALKYNLVIHLPR